MVRIFQLSLAIICLLNIAAMIVRLQSWFRMLKHNFVYKQWKRQRIDRMYMFFRAWYTAIRADILFRVSSL
jgi:hypothetical protein